MLLPQSLVDCCMVALAGRPNLSYGNQSDLLASLHVLELSRLASCRFGTAAWQFAGQGKGAASLVAEATCPAARLFQSTRAHAPEVVPAAAGHTAPAEQNGRAAAGRSRTETFLQGLRRGAPASGSRTLNADEPPSMQHAGGNAGLRG